MPEDLKSPLKGKKITICICGGIAAYKMAEIVGILKKQGAEIRIAMTASACNFITPLTLRTLSGHDVATDIMAADEGYFIPHLELADCDLMLVAPATANILAKAAHGLGDEIVSATILANTAPLLFAPAMNCNMYENTATQENIRLLTHRGYHFIGPDTGHLACNTEGKGRMSKPEDICKRVYELLSPAGPFRGLNVLISAGPTRERIDPARYISNFSSGKMGYNLAEAASLRGANVLLISGPVGLKSPSGVKTVKIESALEMQAEIEKAYPKMDLIIMCAAVADYRPALKEDIKLKKKSSARLELIANPDILEALGQKKGQKILVGFAAETNDLDIYAREKLEKKNLDMIIANNISLPGAGFETDTNIISIYTADGKKKAYPKLTKRQAADEILNAISNLPGFLYKKKD